MRARFANYAPVDELQRAPKCAMQFLIAEKEELFDNRDQKLWPGQFVDTYLTLSEHPDAVLVPSQAVQTGQDGSYVFVIDHKMKAAIRTVAVGDTIEGDTVIESGLRGGETVVTDGQLRLIPGGTVMIKKADQGSQRAAS